MQKIILSCKIHPSAICVVPFWLPPLDNFIWRKARLKEAHFSVVVHTSGVFNFLHKLSWVALWRALWKPPSALRCSLKFRLAPFYELVKKRNLRSTHTLLPPAHETIYVYFYTRWLCRWRTWLYLLPIYIEWNVAFWVRHSILWECGKS